MATPWTVTERGARLAVRVTPGARMNAIEGIEDRPGIGAQLRVRVREAPDKGRANKAVLQLLAKALDLPASRLTLFSGDAARDKVIEIEGDPGSLAHKLETLACRDGSGASP